MTLKNCLKISYKGLTRYIVCDLKFQYDDLLDIVLDKFNINRDYKLAIEFYDEQGHKYNKDTFEYFLLLFPNPKKIFFIRLDSAKLQTTQQQHSSNTTVEYNDRSPLGKSKSNNVAQAEEPADTTEDCKAVPVSRQNCFIGSWPSATQNPRSLNATEEMLALEIVQRMKRLKQTPPKKKRLNNPNNFKRSLRI